MSLLFFYLGVQLVCPHLCADNLKKFDVLYTVYSVHFIVIVQCKVYSVFLQCNCLVNSVNLHVSEIIPCAIDSPQFSEIVWCAVYTVYYNVTVHCVQCTVNSAHCTLRITGPRPLGQIVRPCFMNIARRRRRRRRRSSLHNI